MEDWQHGRLSPVFVADAIDWNRDYSRSAWEELLELPERRLAEFDPLAANLLVARGLPALAELDVRLYQQRVNDWARDFANRCLPRWEPHFYATPQSYRSDIRFFRLGMLCQYLDLEVGITYDPERRGDGAGAAVLYTDPADLFLHGLLETGRGTCANMAALHVAFAWRFGWPVSLACVASHYLCRFDDGRTAYNIEATQADHGGFKSDPDEYLIREKRLPPIALSSGSDLRALTRREMLGVFLGLRARHLLDVGRQTGDEMAILNSEADWLLARRLFPTSRALYRLQLALAVMRGEQLFVPGEAGHPATLADCLEEVHARSRAGWRQAPTKSGRTHQGAIDQFFSQMES